MKTLSFSLFLVPVLGALFSPPLFCRDFPGPGGVGRFPLTWKTPRDDPRSSLPLGNGDISLNVWVDTKGDLLFYVGKTDSWGDNGRLLKVGRLRFHVPGGNPPIPGFSETLGLADGTFRFTIGKGKGARRGRVWVDARHPVVVVELSGESPFPVEASLEPWRKKRETLPSLEVSDVLLDRSRPGNMHAPCVVEPDTFIEGTGKGIGWYHYNVKSVGPNLTGKIQGTAGLHRPDPLLHRIFGGLLLSKGAKRKGPALLFSPPAKTHVFSLHLLTLHPSTPEKWLAALEKQAGKVEALSLEERRRAHEAWWEAFWNRSWIQVSRRPGSPALPLVPPSPHPLRAGEDQGGGNPFPGTLGRVSVFDRPLSPGEIQALAAPGPGPALSGQTGLLGSWTRPKPGPLELPAGKPLSSFTLEAWIRIPPGTKGVGRILDRITPGGRDGFLLDTYPGMSLRFIAGSKILLKKKCLTPGTWHHAAAVADSDKGLLLLYLDGKEAARLEVPEEAFLVSRAYALQRYVTACAGRGGFPIKFNGSIFTVPWPGKPGNADYRRWGPGYWWQNSRLPYLSLCAAGDFEMMRPFFRMYLDRVLPAARFRTKLYFGHGGAFMSECVYFWGDIFSESYGWKPWSERKDRLQVNPYHKYEWVGGLELVWMALDYYEYTLDKNFLRERVLPAARDILAFFDEHYGRDEKGKLLMHPAQALETWWDCTNPMPEIAGIRAVTQRLLSLPAELSTPADRSFWKKVLDEAPPLPTRKVKGETMLAPAARFALKRNIENPELYAVFPFRLVGIGEPHLDWGIRALHHRWDRGAFGWRQDDIFMACLGLAEEARKYVTARASRWNRESRFPGFFGPNYDWVPDQDHGGILMKALQFMLLQDGGRKILLLPAWPREWDVDFKLHAPYRTTLRGKWAGGKWLDLQVDPPSRRKDLVFQGGR